MNETAILEHRHRFALPDTPPELVSSSASSYSSRSSPTASLSGISTNTTSFSMPSYEKAPILNMSSNDKIAESGHSRMEPNARPGSHQQLPSLSSLFGPPSAVRPLHSPHSERPGTYPLTSPLDRPRLSAGGHHNSYFPQTSTSPSISQPRSTYEAKFDQERHSLQPLVRSFSGSSSPRFHDTALNRSSSRSETESGGKWPMQHDSSRHEYALGSRDTGYRSPPDHFRLQFPGPRDPALGYQEHRPVQGGPNPPPTPASTVASDGIPSKDGLGPKIWTGTHFLPRFVRAAEVPGEGMCYFYDDGSHCKTVIDGEAVNAHWGVTKAGKPRKRLAIACITCREKKIKCDPDYPRCVQCEKFGRICKFKNAPRGGHNLSPSTPPAELDDMRKLGDTPRSNETRLCKSDGGSPISPRLALRQASPETGPNKRQRLDNGVYIPNGDHLTAVPRSPEQCKSKNVIQQPAPDLPRLPDEVLSRAWRTDPYVSDPQSISAVISQFFDHVDNTIILRFIPEEVFKTWLANTAHKKSAEELMLVYSMLAMGVLLSGGPKHIAAEYAQVAQFAQKTSPANDLYLVQSRALLAMYYISTSRRREADELLSAATGTAVSLQLNVELERSRDAALQAYPFGMNKACFSEARRRTFWSVFMLERLNGFFPERMAMLHAEDVYLRLPADSRTFERQLDSSMPFFHPSEPQTPSMVNKLTDAPAYLVEMVHIWATCEQAIYRMARRRQSSTSGVFSMQELLENLDRWHRALPSELTMDTLNIEQIERSNHMGLFLTMHLLFHHAMVQAHRFHHPSSRLSEDARADLVHQCRTHSKKVLEIGGYIERILQFRPTILNNPPPASTSILMEAVDVLSASGLVSNASEFIRDFQMVKTLIDRTAAIWEDSGIKKEFVAERLNKLSLIRDQQTVSRNPNFDYRVEENKESKGLSWIFNGPMEPLCPENMDVVYMSHDSRP